MCRQWRASLGGREPAAAVSLGRVVSGEPGGGSTPAAVGITAMWGWDC